MNLPVGTPSIISTTELAARLGVTRSAVWKWVANDVKWRCCIVRQSRRKIWLSVQRLIDTGILPRPDRPPVEPMPGLSFTYDTKTRVR